MDHECEYNLDISAGFECEHENGLKQEMMSTKDAEILKHVADYKLNLIEPAAMEADDLARFHSSLGSVLGFIKYSNNSDKLDAFFSKDRGLKRLDVEAARVIRACTNTAIQFDEKAEVIDVCKAVQEMNEKARLWQSGIACRRILLRK